MKTVSILLALLLPATMAGAGTAAEARMSALPMPHQDLPAQGVPTLVHLVRLDATLDSATLAAQQAELKRDVAQCSAQHQRQGLPVKPVQAYPDYRTSRREDLYLAPNRSIRYAYGIVYHVDWQDCSLLEVAGMSATLHSARGICRVDLVRKTASGACDADGHAGAMAAPQPGGAASAPMQAGLGGPTGNSKDILGVRCAVWTHAQQGSTCVAEGGSFARGAAPPYFMTIERRAAKGFSLEARQVQLDAKVNHAVFTPYLGAGFTIHKANP